MKHDNKTIDPEGFLLVKNDWHEEAGFTGKVKLPNGAKFWYKNGKLHREDGPAVEYADGGKYWFKNGLRHREDGPAIDHRLGKEWFRNGKIHRENGPAIIRDDGSVEWWYNDKHGLENFPPEIKKNLARKFIHEAW